MVSTSPCVVGLISTTVRFFDFRRRRRLYSHRPASSSSPSRPLYSQLDERRSPWSVSKRHCYDLGPFVATSVAGQVNKRNRRYQHIRHRQRASFYRRIDMLDRCNSIRVGKRDMWSKAVHRFRNIFMAPHVPDSIRSASFTCAICSTG